MPTGGSKQWNQDAMCGAQTEIQLEHISDGALHHHDIVSDVNWPISKLNDFLFHPRSQTLRTGNDDRILFIRPNLH